MEELLYRYNPWWEEEYTTEGIIERPAILELLLKYLSGRQIIFLTGLRRVGKTTLMKLLIKNLIKKEKIQSRRILYVSLDDYQLSRNTILQIVEEFRKIHKIKFEEKIFLFLDEIAYKKDYELQLKNLYDSHNAKFYASSSSAIILKRKKSYLTGRNIVLEVLPLDFQEYLTFKQVHISKRDSHLTDRYFEEYLFTGGLPEFVLRNDVGYLKELVDDIIQKDIAAYHNIRNTQTLKDFFLLLMERAGKAVSINKLARILKISPDTAKRYLEMFADTYLIYLISRCGKTNERILSPKKIYAADLGIRTFFTGFRDKGSLFENYVFLKIKDKKPCYIYENGYEIDFLTDELSLIEVKYHSTISEKQLFLFNKIKSKRKIIISSLRDMGKLFS